jgi:hypothetical protein
MSRDDDEDDDRPRKRRPRDEDDDRPRSRRRPRDDEDEDRPRRRPRDEDDYDDRPRKRKKKKKPQQSVLGAVALTTGLVGLALSFSCGAIGLVPAVIGLGLGVIALVIAQKSGGRQSPVLPLAGSAVSLVATVVSVIFLMSFIRTVKEVRKDIKEGMEQAVKEEAERKKERAKAAGEVQAAGAGGAVQVPAGQFAKAYEDDEDRADALYKNKVIEVTGTIDEVDLDGDTYAVVLKAGRGRTADCSFAKSPEVRARLAQLKPGDMVRIRGKCLGGTPSLEACVLVE